MAARLVERLCLFDSLTHLPLFASPEETRAFLDHAARAGVTDMLCAGTKPTREIILEVPAGRGMRVRVHRAFGIHPEHARASDLDVELAALQRKLDAVAGGVVALGECGLDHRSGQLPLDEQERALRAQLAVARAKKLPVILHLVGAWSRALDILDEDGPLPAGGIWHAFGGPKEAIVRAQRLGLALSIGGLVLNPHSRRLHEAIPLIAPELLVVETDMPHEPPVRLQDVVSQLALVLGVPSDDVAQRTADNARRIFRVQ